MPQELLYRPNVSPVVEHVGGAGVSQHMRAELPLQPHPGTVPPQHVPCPLATQPAPSSIEEDGLGVTSSSPLRRDDLRTTSGSEPGDERAQRVVANGDDALLGALAERSQQRVVEVEVAHREPHQL